jgi:hypothetical protein
MSSCVYNRARYNTPQALNQSVLISANGGAFTDTGTITSVAAIVEEMHDYSAPGWEKAKNQGSLVIHPCYVHDVLLVKDEGTVSFTDNYWNTYTMKGPLWPYIVGPSSLQTTSSDRPSVALYETERLAVEQTAFARQNESAAEVLVAIAEFKKTVDLLTGAYKNFAHTVQHVVSHPKARKYFSASNKVSRKAAFSRIRKLNGKTYRNPKDRRREDAIADTWLGYRYGWTPLALDIEGLVAAATRKLWKLRVITRASSTHETDTPGTLYSGYKYPYKKVYRVQGHRNITALATAGVACDYSLAMIWKLQQFGLTSLPTATWELVPYSFVVDWFVNVGEYITAHSPTYGVTSKKGWSSLKMVQIQSQAVIGLEGEHSDFESVSPASAEERVVDTVYHRRCVYSSPHLLTLRVNLDWKRLLDSVALIRGIRRRSSKTWRL